MQLLFSVIFYKLYVSNIIIVDTQQTNFTFLKRSRATDRIWKMLFLVWYEGPVRSCNRCIMAD